MGCKGDGEGQEIIDLDQGFDLGKGQSRHAAVKWIGHGIIGADGQRCVLGLAMAM